MADGRGGRPWRAARAWRQGIRARLRKQLALDHSRVREARKQRAPRPVFPKLWVIATGKPETVLAGYRLGPMEGYPPGFYGGAAADARAVVVLRELPKTRETLLLRLLGHGSVLKGAVAELARLPRGVWEKEVALPPLVAAKFEIKQDPTDEADKEFVMNMTALYEEWKQKVTAEGIEIGLQTGMLSLYEARFGAVPEEVRAVVEATHDAATLRRWNVLFGTRGEDEVKAALLVKG